MQPMPTEYHRQTSGSKGQVPGQDSSSCVCCWFLHLDISVVRATALKQFDKCLEAAGLLCSTINCWSCVIVCSFFLTLNQTCPKACLCDWTNLSLGCYRHWGRMAKIMLHPWCFFGRGSESSDHMQITSALAESVQRIRNKTGKIPVP